MSSYYREHVSFPNVTSGPAPPYPPPPAAVDGARTFGHGDSNGAPQEEGSNARHCSVKGCAAVLAPAYPHKMCEECRSRHRTYANTKRAKRKMEKALLNSGQPVAWMPDDGASQQDEHAHPGEPVAGPSRSFEIPQTNDESSQAFDYSQGWDPRALDPSLFSQASELAGALTLPHGHAHPTDHALFDQPSYQLHHLQHQAHHQQALHHARHLQHHQQLHQNNGPPPPPPAPEIHPALAEVLKSVPNLMLSTRITSGPTVPVGASAPPVDGQLPPRFCSIKGCKTLIAGNSFFKMCEPCRNRYRNYGTTKRAKWRKEKEVAVHELKQLRDEEDKRRAEQGLPPLPPDDDEIWHEYAASPPDGSGSGDAGPSAQGSVDGQPAPRPPRMCTVSHCREILPGDYQYLRCERHRIQNRHHSKLKRVRDKEVKAQVYDGWAAAAGLRDPSSGDADGMDDDEGSMSGGDQETDAQLDLQDIERHLRDASLDAEYALPQVVSESGVMLAGDHGAGVDGEPLDETPLGEPTHGVPPAARGSRRTNHVCSIRACANLLSPSNPWKMCDLCRSRDRAGRRLKALRDSGLIPPEVVDPKLERMRLEVEGKGSRNMSGTPPGEKKSKKGKKKKGETADVKNAAAGDAHGGGEAVVGMGDIGTTSGEMNAGPSMDAGVGGMSNGSIAPSALQRISLPAQGLQPADANSSTSVFSSLPVSDQSNIVFMDPLSPEQAAQIKARHEKITGAPSTAGLSSAESSSASLGNVNAEQAGKEGDTASASVTGAPKKRGKGKGKSKAKQQNTDEATPTSQAVNPSGGPEPSQAADAPHPSNVDASQGAPPQYPQGYPYFMQPPYMPYPPPPNYVYPYSPPKGSYPHPPPMYAPPYGAYPYPYPGQPYGYPGPYAPPPGHPYLPPPPGQGYPVQSSPQPGQAYLPPQSYQYAYPPPPPYQSPPTLPSPAPAEQSEQQSEQQPQQQQVEQEQQERPQTPQPIQPLVYNNTFPPTPPKTQQENADQPEASAPSSSEPGRPQHPQRFSTFIVRTEETYQNGQHGSTSANGAPGAKRKRSDEGELECGSAYSKFRLQPPMPSAASMGVHVAHHVDRVAVTVVESPQLVEVTQPSASPPSDKISSCSNKNCKRLLSAGCSGSLCDRCKERLKKKQAKAKHRFKLEPKSLLGRSASVQPSGSGSATPVVAAVVG